MPLSSRFPVETRPCETDVCRLTSGPQSLGLDNLLEDASFSDWWNNCYVSPKFCLAGYLYPGSYWEAHNQLSAHVPCSPLYKCEPPTSPMPRALIVANQEMQYTEKARLPKEPSRQPTPQSCGKYFGGWRRPALLIQKARDNAHIVLSPGFLLE